jgi:sugar phosphate isomerase/epimerase
MQRKEFLKISSLAATGLLINQANALGFLSNEESKKRIKKFGIQLWSVRDAMAKDPKGVISTLAKNGYKLIESFDGEKGMFWGMTAIEFKKLLADNNLQMKSAHCNLNDNFEKKADAAKSIGMEYLIYPWEGPSKTIDDYKKLANDFNAKGEYLKKMDLKLAFHNHDYTFNKLEGQFAQDVLMQNTEADLVDYQMDMYWVVTAGQDPIEWMKKYPNRFTLCHVKDRKKNEPSSNTSASCVLGTGQINYHKILSASKQLGMKYFVVEQELYNEGTPMQCAASNARFMKNLKI